MRLVWTEPAIADRMAIYDHFEVENPRMAAEMDERCCLGEGLSIRTWLHAPLTAPGATARSGAGRWRGRAGRPRPAT